MGKMPWWAGSNTTPPNYNKECETLRAELTAIHEVVMCIACVKDAPETDSYTLREVKRMALRIQEMERHKSPQP
jgi:hypothetical protein